MYDEHDDISLRDLYRGVLRGLPWIVLLTVIAGAAAFAVVSLRPAHYRAQAVVQITPPQLGSVAEVAPVDGTTTFDLETVRALSRSAPVWDEVAAALQAGPAERTRVMDAAGLSRIAATSGGALVVAQAVTLPDAERAAAAANAWARATRDAVRAAFRRQLDAVQAVVDAEVTSRAADLEGADAAWEAFLRDDDRDAIQAQLDTLVSRQGSAQQRLDQLEQNLASVAARQKITAAVAEARTNGTPAPVQDQLQALQQAGAIDAGTVRDLTVALADTPPGGVPAGQDLATLVARVQLQDDAAILASATAERQVLTQRVDGFGSAATSLRARLAALDRQAETLTRQRDDARAAYQRVADAAPQLALAADLTDASVRVLDEAVPPRTPVADRRLLITVAAAVVTFAVAALLVLARAALVAPAAGARETTAEGPGAGRPGVAG